MTYTNARLNALLDEVYEELHILEEDEVEAYRTEIYEDYLEDNYLDWLEYGKAYL